MKYENIKDFSQRCEEHPDHQTGMISERMIQDRLSEEIDELRAYIETKQEQGEPVAWVIWFCGYPAGFFEKETDAIEAFEQRNLDYPEESRKLLPLYTTPQQRTWVGLTDEEAEAIWEDHQFNGRPSEVSFANRMNLMQAIEAKLKDKNL